MVVMVAKQRAARRGGKAAFYEGYCARRLGESLFRRVSSNRCVQPPDLRCIIEEGEATAHRANGL
jgi:hypothetical protein